MENWERQLRLYAASTPSKTLEKDLIKCFEELENTRKENYELRSFICMNHGCSFGAIYYDDGELHCNECKIDFKRLPIAKIAELLRTKNSNRTNLYYEMDNNSRG